MNVTVLVGPAASGKSAAAMDRLRRAAPGLLVVPDTPTRRQLARQFRGHRCPGRPAPRILTLYGLAQLVLARAGVTTRALTSQAHVRLVRQLIQQRAAAGALPTLAPIAGTAGLAHLIGDLLIALQEADLSPASFAAAGVTPHDAEVAGLYAGYLARQAALGMAGIARRVLLARDTLRDHPGLLAGITMIAFDGFDQFSPLQLSLLQMLARSVPELIITLTSADTRRALGRFSRTYDQVVATFAPAVVTLPARAGASPILAHLRAHLFRPGAPRIAGHDAVRLIEAPDPEREVRAVLRDVRRRLSAGVHPGSVALLYRDDQRYAPLIREVAAEYGLPLRVLAGRPLHAAPEVIVRLAALHLAADDFPRRPLVEVLRAIDPPAAAALDRVARAAGITGTLARWRAALDRFVDAPAQSDDDEPPALTPAAARALRTQLDTLATACTPPEHASVAEYATWVRQGPWALLLAGREAAGQQADAHDDPLPRLEELLDGMVSAAESLGDYGPWPYTAFLHDLEEAVGGAQYARQRSGPGAVSALPMLQARSATFDHLYLLGAADGDMPRPMPETALYGRYERAELQRRGLALGGPGLDDEPALFYTAVCRARQTLTISRTRLDERGNPLAPSPYVRALCDLLETPPPVQLIAAGSPPALDDAGSPAELLIALAAAGDQVPDVVPNQPPWYGRPLWDAADPPAPAALLAAAHARLAAEPAWRLVQHARSVEACRAALDVSFGVYEGCLEAGATRTAVAARFGASHLWSVTQLNDYITCPFRFAAAHVLGLAARIDPEEQVLGSDVAATRGRIMHSVLASAANRWRAEQLAPVAADEERLVAHLHGAADEVFAQAPTRFGVVPSASWEWSQVELRRTLERALRRMLRDNDDWAAFSPAAIEASFGMHGRAPLQIDTASGTVLVAGRVDRVDQRADGALAVIDYKSSSTPRPLKETEHGRDVQLPIYILAVEQILARGQHQYVERAAFVHLGSGKRSAPLTADKREAVLATMRDRVAMVVAGTHQGDFAVRPLDRCPEECPFDPICRKNLRKQRSGGASV